MWYCDPFKGESVGSIDRKYPYVKSLQGNTHRRKILYSVCLRAISITYVVYKFPLQFIQYENTPELIGN